MLKAFIMKIKLKRRAYSGISVAFILIAAILASTILGLAFIQLSYEVSQDVGNSYDNAISEAGTAVIVEGKVYYRISDTSLAFNIRLFQGSNIVTLSPEMTMVGLLVKTPEQTFKNDTLGIDPNPGLNPESGAVEITTIRGNPWQPEANSRGEPYLDDGEIFELRIFFDRLLSSIEDTIVGGTSIRITVVFEAGAPLTLERSLPRTLPSEGVVELI